MPHYSFGGVELGGSVERRATNVLFSQSFSSPFDYEADPVALVQDAFELGDSVGAGSLEGDLVRDADDLHRSRIAGYFAVGHRHHVVQTQGLRWRKRRERTM